MGLTKNKAIRECKKLWKDIKQSGLTKSEYFKQNNSAALKYGHYINQSPLCEYVNQYWSYGVLDCSVCPLFEQYKQPCWELGLKTDELSSDSWYECIENLKEDKMGELICEGCGRDESMCICEGSKGFRQSEIVEWLRGLLGDLNYITPNKIEQIEEKIRTKIKELENEY